MEDFWSFGTLQTLPAAPLRRFFMATLSALVFQPTPCHSQMSGKPRQRTTTAVLPPKPTRLQVGMTATHAPSPSSPSASTSGSRTRRRCGGIRLASLWARADLGSTKFAFPVAEYGGGTDVTYDQCRHHRRVMTPPPKSLCPLALAWKENHHSALPMPLAVHPGSLKRVHIPLETLLQA